jgi:protein SCO1
MKRVNPWKQWVGAGAALAVFAFLGLQVLGTRPSDRLIFKPNLKAPDFAYPERGGKVFDSASLKGKVWAVDFVFTHCAGSCPMISQQMKYLQTEWKGNPDFKLVTFSVDPERDTVEALRKYADGYGAEPDQWFFLTGPKEGLYKTIRDGFKAAAEKDPLPTPGFEFIHTTRIYLVDGRGMIRGFYDGQDEADLKKLHQDVKFLMSSGSRS